MEAAGVGQEVGPRGREEAPGALRVIVPCIACGETCPSQVEHLPAGVAQWQHCSGCDPYLDETPVSPCQVCPEDGPCSLCGATSGPLEHGQEGDR
jgi:hypothetical protein